MSVYVFGEPGSLIVKIGFSHNPKARIVNLRPQIGMPDGKILYQHGCRGAIDNDVEQRAHKLLRRRFWFTGEWFVCGVAIAKSVIRHVARRERVERIAYFKKRWAKVRAERHA